MHDRIHQQALRIDEEVSLLAFDLLAAVEARGIDPTPPCIFPLPAAKQSASLSMDGSPQPPRVSEPEKQQGAPPLVSPRTRTVTPAKRARICKDGSWNASPLRQPSSGLMSRKDRQDVHMCPSGEAFAVLRDGKGLEQLVNNLRKLAPALIVLEATGGFEITVAAALASAGIPLAVVNPRQIRAKSGILPVLRDASPRPMHSTPRSSPCSLNVFVPNHARSPPPRARAGPN
jgi:hypothetical protein